MSTKRSYKELTTEVKMRINASMESASILHWRNQSREHISNQSQTNTTHYREKTCPGTARSIQAFVSLRQEQIAIWNKQKKLILYKRELVRETRLAKENIVRAAPHFLRLCIGMVKRLSCWFKNVSVLSRLWQKIVAWWANSTNKFNKLSRAKEHSSHFYSQSETQITRKEKELEFKSWYFSLFETENSSFAETIGVSHSQDCAYKDK